MENTILTPVRKQYLDIKREHPDAIVFFRLGDFYETFDEDAEITSRELDIVLTSRSVSKGQRIPMAGIPFHAAENYIGKLIEKGFRIAICEQIGEQPQRGLFPREVVRIITAGTLTEPGLLKNEKNNFIASIYPHDRKCGVTFADVSTGSFQTSQIEIGTDFSSLRNELERIQPTELLVPESFVFFDENNFIVTKLPDWKFEESRCIETIKSHFEVSTVDGLGLRDYPLSIRSSGALLQYIKTTNPQILLLLNNLRTYSTSQFMTLDAVTRRNLELTESMRDKSNSGTLLNVIDNTVTPMGKRLLRQWISQPLVNLELIGKRQDFVECAMKNGMSRNEVINAIKPVCDIERVFNRIRAKSASPRDLVALRSTLRSIQLLRNRFKNIPDIEQLKLIIDSIHPFDKQLDLLEQAIVPDPPATLQHSGLIVDGYSQELDQIKAASEHARNWIGNLEKSEKERTGIKTLKVGYNKIFGYYLEISRSLASQAPAEYIRKQTLVNGERFITPELKEYESLVLNADDRIREIENRIFNHICEILSKASEIFLQAASAIAELDVYLSLAETAANNHYCRPVLSADTRLDIHDGRHPVVEKSLRVNQFVPNDCCFESNEIIRIITGPNMSGKSTFLRQVALIVVLAQIGSFVPAKSANIGVVDQIFTRIGAQDEIFSGQSTFMVEMVETANILNSATPRSLIIMDEIGRGTSTYDGLAIAWSVIEHIHNHPRLRSRTLFATHFHELIQLSRTLPGLSNFNVAVSEVDNNVVFLHRIIPGGADRSYGIHVAQIAGIPNTVIARAKQILQDLEDENRKDVQNSSSLSETQLPLIISENRINEEIQNLDLEMITPLDALNKLYELKKRIQNL